MPRTNRSVAIVGCGQTSLTRTAEIPETELALAACRQAAEEAGLDAAVVDGLNLQVHHYPPPDSAGIAAGLGISDVRWYAEGGQGASALGRAAAALDVGACQYVLVCKIMNTVAPVLTPNITPDTGRVGGWEQFEVPFGLGYTMQRVGLTFRRWMDRYGISYEQIAWLCTTQRDHALRNPQAFFRTPLSIEEYLAARWITEPLRVLDCDYPVNGASAYLMTTADRAADLRQRPVWLSSWAASPVSPFEFHLVAENIAEGPNPWLGALYHDAGITPQDLDLWMLYDGFSYFVPQWMEALGVVPRGGSGEYINGGTRIRFDGEHPVNTHGGMLSEGRLHGAGHIVEACRQLRGQAEGRQAANPTTAVVTTAFPNAGSAAILTLDSTRS